MKNKLSGLSTYLRFILRRERVASAVWILGIAAFSAIIALIYPSLLPTQAEVTQMAVSMNNPAMVAMMGKVYGMDALSQSIMMSQECLIWLLCAAAVMNIFLVNRHTRQDEELGRLEMICALPVGRLTGSVATALVALLVNLLTAVLAALALLAANIEGTSASGAVAYGLSISAVGLVFAGLTLVLAQIFSTSAGVSGMSFALLGLFYIMRAMGDVADNALSIISPLGMGLAAEAFYSNKLYPALILVIEAVALTGVALWLCAVRDQGYGVIPARKGRAVASRFLRGPFGLAWRLCRGLVLGWAAVMFVLGAAYGSICADINAFVESNEMMLKIIGEGGSLLDSYVSMIFVIMSMLASVPVMLIAMKIYSEEKRGRLEHVFSRAVPRVSMYAAYIALAAVASAVMMLALALGTGAASGGELDMAVLIKAALNFLPALWVMTGLAVLLVGAAPRLNLLVWLVFGYSFFVLFIGRMMDLPLWATKLTPFGSVPQLPVEEFSHLPLVVLTLIAAALTAIGLWRYRLRDIG